MFEALLAAGALGADVVLVNTGLGPGQLETVLHEQQIRLLKAPETGLLTTGRMPAYLMKRTGGVVGIFVASQTNYSLASGAGLGALLQSALQVFLFPVAAYLIRLTFVLFS